MCGPTSVPQQFPTKLLVLNQEFRDDHPQGAILPSQLLPIRCRVDLLDSAVLDVCVSYHGRPPVIPVQIYSYIRICQVGKERFALD